MVVALAALQMLVHSMAALAAMPAAEISTSVAALVVKQPLMLVKRVRVAGPWLGMA
jgi:hypothetical protein